MAGGGYRPGSGRKPKAPSLSEEALASLAAVVYGLGDSLVLAGRQIVPEAEDPEAMRAAVAGIGHDNILAGNGMRVIELFAAGLERLTRVSGGEKQAPKSLLEEALRALPGTESGNEWAQGDPYQDPKPDVARPVDSRTVDRKSSVPALEQKVRPDAPVFQPQGTLFPALGPGAGGRAGAPAEPPLPPRTPPPRQGFHLGAENFDFSGGGE